VSGWGICIRAVLSTGYLPIVPSLAASFNIDFQNVVAADKICSQLGAALSQQGALNQRYLPPYYLLD